MRDLHFDGEFLRDFNESSKQWSWASWHEVRAAEEQTARRLLEQVFGASEERPSAGDAGEGEN
jgi:hypothetical protein